MKSALERRQMLLEVLCQRRYDTIAHLAIEFSMSPRTIHYDLKVLQCSYPIETVRGNGGGVRVVEGGILAEPI